MTPTDYEPGTGEDDGDREIAKDTVVLKLRWKRRRPKVGRDPIGYKRGE